MPFEEKGTLAHWKLKNKCKNDILRRIKLKSISNTTLTFAKEWISFTDLQSEYQSNDSIIVQILTVKFIASGPYNNRNKDHFTIQSQIIIYDIQGQILRHKTFTLDFDHEEYEKLDSWLNKMTDDLWTLLQK